MDLSIIYKIKIHLQRFLGNLAFLGIGIIVVVILKKIYKFEIIEHKKHKEFFRNLLKDRKPILICSNHLTMIDSVILQYAFGDYFTYLFHYWMFSWNVPAKEVFAKNWFLKTFLFLAKCIPIDRYGSSEHHQNIMEQTKYILLLKEPFIIFPEGARSRKGTFDLENLTYGIGKILYDLPEVEVLCVYLRGNKQKTFTNFPEKESKFYLDYQLIHPKTNTTRKLQAEKELALQVGGIIKQLEEKYFNLHNSKV